MDSEIRNKILDFVHTRPRAVAEIALLIGKNWRTADRYLGQLADEDLIKLHIFRKGGRGALKIAFWPTSILETPSAVKNSLFQRIISGVKKEDFSSLDIIQFIPSNKRHVNCFSKAYYESAENVASFLSSLDKAEKQLLFFSGNLSFTQIDGDITKFIAFIRKKLEYGVNIYILTRVDVTNGKIVRALVNLNSAGLTGKIYMRYAHQPLRCTIIDDNICFLKENMAIYSKAKDVNTASSTFIYTLMDRDWISWLEKVFWYMWHGSIDADKRLAVIDEVSIK